MLCEGITIAVILTSQGMVYTIVACAASAKKGNSEAVAGSDWVIER